MVPLARASGRFYASAIAMSAVVLFSKFATHHVRQGKSSDLKPTGGWYWAPGICVAAAWVGLFASLAVLGKVPLGTLETFSRWVVFVTAAISGTLLAFDVAVTGHNPLTGVAKESVCTREEARTFADAKREWQPFVLRHPEFVVCDL